LCQGQVLARLDSESLDQSVSEQQAQLAGNQSRLKLARIKLDKQHELLQKGFISQLAYDEAESEYTVRQGELAGAKQPVGTRPPPAGG
jgi:multidrug resistance efflux pump